MRKPWRHLHETLTPGWLMIMFAILVHAGYGICDLVAGMPLSVAATARTSLLFPWWASGCGYLLIASGALYGLVRGSLHGLLPQQIVLTISAGDAFYCAWYGRYADGYVPAAVPAWFILKDQLPVIVAAALHSYALMVRYVLPWVEDET